MNFWPACVADFFRYPRGRCLWSDFPVCDVKYRLKTAGTGQRGTDAYSSISADLRGNKTYRPRGVRPSTELSMKEAQQSSKRGDETTMDSTTPRTRGSVASHGVRGVRTPCQEKNIIFSVCDFSVL